MSLWRLLVSPAVAPLNPFQVFSLSKGKGRVRESIKASLILTFSQRRGDVVMKCQQNLTTYHDVPSPCFCLGDEQFLIKSRVTCQ